MNGFTRRRRAGSLLRQATLAALAAMLLLLAPGAASPSSAAAEEIVFRSHRDGGTQDLYVVRRDGAGLRRLTFSADFERAPRWSPDGSKVAFSALRDGNWDVWVIGRDGTGLTRLTTDPARDDTPAWTADGRVLFARGPFECPCDLHLVNADGSGERRLDVPPVGAGGFDAAAHGRRLAFARDGAIWVAGGDGENPRRLTPVGSGDSTPRFSPNGNELVFQRWESGQHDLYLVGVGGQGLRRLTDTPNRLEQLPSWSRSGGEILVSRFGPGGEDQALWAIRADGSGETRLSTAPQAPYHVDFARDGVDTGFWHVIHQGTGASLEQVRGRLELSIAADAREGGDWNTIEAHVGTQCSLPGDFDLAVDYELLEWPERNGTQAELSGFFANAGVSRDSSQWAEQYLAWLDGAGGWATTEDTRGSMRLVRAGGRTTAYWLYEGVWVPLRSRPANPAAVTAGLTIRSFGGQFAGRPVRVAFDDFRIRSGELRCPDWWNAVMGDFGPAG